MGLVLVWIWGFRVMLFEVSGILEGFRSQAWGRVKGL